MFNVCRRIKDKDILYVIFEFLFIKKYTPQSS